MVDLSELKRRRRKKRRPLTSTPDKRHFQLSPLGGAKSKVLVEKLPLEVEGVALVKDTENVEHKKANGDVKSLETYLNELTIAADETDRDSATTINKTGQNKSKGNKAINSNIMSKSLTETETFNSNKSDKSITRSIPDLLTSTKGSTNDLRIKPVKCVDLLMKQESEIGKKNFRNNSGVSPDLNFNLKHLPGNISIDSSPDVSIESPTSSEEFYQTFIEGDLDSHVSPKLNLNTHPALMKSDSEPINVHYSNEIQSNTDDDWVFDNAVILPSPTKIEDSDVIFDLNSVIDTSSPSMEILIDSPRKEAQERQETFSSLKCPHSERVLSDPNSLSDPDSQLQAELVNRASDVSLMSMDSEASRFSYANLPGIDISFANDDTEITEL